MYFETEGVQRLSSSSSSSSSSLILSFNLFYNTLSTRCSNHLRLDYLEHLVLFERRTKAYNSVKHRLTVLVVSLWTIFFLLDLWLFIIRRLRGSDSIRSYTFSLLKPCDILLPIDLLLVVMHKTKSIWILLEVYRSPDDLLVGKFSTQILWQLRIFMLLIICICQSFLSSN